MKQGIGYVGGGLSGFLRSIIKKPGRMHTCVTAVFPRSKTVVEEVCFLVILHFFFFCCCFLNDSNDY